MADAEPHSQLYFTDARDHWWNDDFVALLAKRLGLGAARRVLDVGAGQGHFARLWAPHLAPDFEIVCVDPEPRSLEVARARGAAFLAHTGLRGRFEFVAGRAEALPFEAGAFDAAICQTLLIHLRDPAHALVEMTRVVRERGLVLASEPNNFGGLQRLAALGPEADPEDAVRALRFDALCMRGKYRLGLGWNNLGVHLPRWFSGLADVAYFQNDRPWVLAPPYVGAQQSAALSDLRSMHARGIWHWSREEARGYFEAGGGDPARFDEEYAAGLAGQAQELAAVDAGTWCELTGVVQFVAAGFKKSRSGA